MCAHGGRRDWRLEQRAPPLCRGGATENEKPLRLDGYMYCQWNWKQWIMNFSLNASQMCVVETNWFCKCVWSLIWQLFKILFLPEKYKLNLFMHTFRWFAAQVTRYTYIWIIGANCLLVCIYARVWIAQCLVFGSLTGSGYLPEGAYASKLRCPAFRHCDHYVRALV